MTQKIMKTQEPQQIYNLFSKPKLSRKCTKIILKNNNRTQKARRNFISLCDKLYNSIPASIKGLPHKKFKKRLRKYEFPEIRIDSDIKILKLSNYNAGVDS